MGGHKAKLMTLLTIGEPFQRMAIDIVVPLPYTQRGHTLILTFIDYETRYPEATAL